MHRAVALLDEIAPSLRGKSQGDKIMSALTMLKGTSKPSRAPPKRQSTQQGNVVINLNELDPKYRNIAWLVSTRGGLVDEMADLFKYVTGARPVPTIEKIVPIVTHIVGQFLSPVEKIHTGLPPRIQQIESYKVREASEKELLRVLLHSSHAHSTAGDKDKGEKKTTPTDRSGTATPKPSTPRGEGTASSTPPSAAGSPKAEVSGSSFASKRTTSFAGAPPSRTTSSLGSTMRSNASFAGSPRGPATPAATGRPAAKSVVVRPSRVPAPAPTAPPSAASPRKAAPVPSFPGTK